MATAGDGAVRDPPLQAARARLADEKTPPPDIELLSRLQLCRTTIASFVEWRNFEEVVRGCYVRVLLELHSNESDQYYISCIRGVQKGPEYGGFACDGVTTQWQLVIQLPPTFRSTQNGNVIRLTSISNSPFKPSEYSRWMQWCSESQVPFMSKAQMEFRIRLFEEHKQQAASLKPQRVLLGNDPTLNEERKRKLGQMKQEMMDEIQQTYTQFPTVSALQHLNVEDLQQMESEVRDLISHVRLIINERSKCILCKRKMCTVICYPCKHQVLCKDCSQTIHGICPAPGCGMHVNETFEAFSS